MELTGYVTVRIVLETDGEMLPERAFDDFLAECDYHVESNTPGVRVLDTEIYGDTEITSINGRAVESLTDNEVMDYGLV